MYQRILITGGAGFVGSNLALQFKSAYPGREILAMDNLRRRGSELALDRLKRAGVIFFHGDVRRPEDVDRIGRFDLLLECSAEPSVKAGYDGDPRYLIHTNLGGTVNCLEAARRFGAGVVFLSTSRVYPVAALREIPLVREKDRLVVAPDQAGPGWSADGICVDFPLAGSRSMYGATKLCAELLVQEYAAMYGLPSVIDRCGVIAGPWQMGRVDQGFVSLWAARHLFGGKLNYIGFGGGGHQVRDILHVDDLFYLIDRQLSHLSDVGGRIFNVGGGNAVSVSLRELTMLCRERSGNDIPVGTVTDTHPADIPYYVTDTDDVTRATGWRPEKSIHNILADIFSWLETHRGSLRRFFT